MLSLSSLSALSLSFEFLIRALYPEPVQWTMTQERPRTIMRRCRTRALRSTTVPAIRQRKPVAARARRPSASSCTVYALRRAERAVAIALADHATTTAIFRIRRRRRSRRFSSATRQRSNPRLTTGQSTTRAAAVANLAASSGIANASMRACSALTCASASPARTLMAALILRQAPNLLLLEVRKVGTFLSPRSNFYPFACV